jgi:hypothetical protein
LGSEKTLDPSSVVEASSWGSSSSTTRTSEGKNEKETSDAKEERACEGAYEGAYDVKKRAWDGEEGEGACGAGESDLSAIP